MIDKIAARHRFVVARTAAEDTHLPELKDFLLSHPGHIERALIAVMGLPRKSAVEFADEVERAGVLYRAGRGIASYTDGYPSSTKDLSADDKDFAREQIATIKRRNGNKPVFMKVYDCGHSIMLLFASRPLGGNALTKAFVDAMSRSSKAANICWRALKEQGAIHGTGDQDD